jgi:hypothetical protein
VPVLAAFALSVVTVVYLFIRELGRAATLEGRKP